MSEYIAQHILQGISGLPKDQFVTTFHFVGSAGAATVDGAQSCVARIRQFYEVAAGSGGAISSFLSPYIADVRTVKVYDEASAKPRIPMVVGHYTGPTHGSGQCLAPATALCLSYFSVRNAPRHRGRIYLGPLKINAMSGSTDRPSAQFMAEIVAAGTRLADAGDVAESLSDLSFLVGGPPISGPPVPVNWAVRSGVGAGTQPTKKHPTIPNAPVVTYELVNGGWVDDEWDGQSRRRLAAIGRTSWVAP